MNKPWMKWLPVWAAEGEGGGGGEGESDPGTGEDPGKGEGGAAPDPGDGGGKAAPSILDLAGKTGDDPGEGKGESKAEEKPLDPGGWKPPEGIPDHLKGNDADETLAKLAKAYAGARTELAKGGKQTGTIPEAPDGYALKPTGDKDPVAAEWNSPESKVMVDAFQAAAHELKVPAEVFQGLMRKGLEKLQAQGVPIGLTEQEQIEASAEQEFESLQKVMGGHKQAATVVNTVDTYRQKLVDSGLMTKEEESEFRIMVGTGPSAALFYKIMTAEFGERSIPPADPMGGSVSLTDAYAAHAAAMSMKPGAERDAAIAAAQVSIRKAVGTESAGSVKSNVL
jgi:hypothetical protein